MKLDRVTITGADNSVQQDALLQLSQAFPFVEWGILLSRTHEGIPRFPTFGWMAAFVAMATEHGLKLSGHLCGGWVRELCRGDATFAGERSLIADSFQRIQLNFHAYAHGANGDALSSGLRKMNPQQYIFQFDSVNDALLEGVRERGINAVPLFDRSGGAGVLPAEWPKATHEYSGYAGGLSPENVDGELNRIRDAAGDRRIWIDVETHVRSDNDKRFDLDKVERFLEIVAPWVQRS